MAEKLTKEQLAILNHTVCRAPCGFYCGGGSDMKELVEMGLMESAGRKSFVPEEYFRITDKGRNLLCETTGDFVITDPGE